MAHPYCAGIDIGKTTPYVAMPEGADKREVRSFASFTDELHAIAAWLCSCGVDTVAMEAMEATEVYWSPVFKVLDWAGLEVHLVDARATKQVSGRESDVLDCQWIRELMSYGLLLKGAFRPSDQTCMLHSYVRQRARLVRDRARCVQHMQKTLTQMNVQLDTVLINLMGKTGEAIVRAIVAGERDVMVLARLRHRRVKADEATVARSLRGNWCEEHLFALAQALERYDCLSGRIEQVEQRILDTMTVLAPESEEHTAVPIGRDAALVGALRAGMGVDLTAIPTIGIETALVLACEVGPDLSRFPTPEHFCSWLTLAPGTRISGGKSLKGAPAKRTNRAGQALRMAASTACHNRAFIGACHRARLKRLDCARAIKATAHQLVRLIYAMLTRCETMSNEALSTSRVNAGTANSAISSVRQDTSTWPWCRPSKSPDTGLSHHQQIMWITGSSIQEEVTSCATPSIRAKRCTRISTRSV